MGGARRRTHPPLSRRVIALKPLGILGGTFDPVHHGHLRLAIELREQLNLGEVRLMPAGAPNLRNAPRASPTQRLAMLNLAVEGTGLTVDAREVHATGTTYSVDTLADLRAELGAQPLVFILGQDAFNALPRWHRWQALLDYAHLAVATRPGYQPPADESLRALISENAVTDAHALAARPAGKIFLQTIPLLPIAATDLRARVREGRSIAALTPFAVDSYIRAHNLYQ